MNARPVLSFYGDDFTGSTDVMESLEVNGLKTVLFLDIPAPQLLERFRQCDAFGIAGTSRSETPEWMDENLPQIFAFLKTLGARHAHYKVCSTFDSAPHIGNIGRAAEIGLKIFGQSLAPLILGAPQLKRYTAFGHLFAAYQGEAFRIDRHPVMSRHPVTPMAESDLRLHLKKQTSLQTGLVDLAALSASATSDLLAGMTGRKGLALIDVDGSESQAAAGALLAAMAQKFGPFSVGSSGIEYALAAHWCKHEPIRDKPSFAPPGAVKQIAVVSGSVSPTTERQIRHAAQNGFGLVPVDALDLAGPDGAAVVSQAVTAALNVIEAGGSPLVHSALGPSSDKAAEINLIGGARHRMGRSLGLILGELVTRAKLKRAVIAGGDTSSHALKALEIEALTLLLPLPATPGSPLCRAHRLAPGANELQIALKGGQVGKDDYFAAIRDGKS
jgi:3-oxoisoapionate kinase